MDGFYAKIRMAGKGRLLKRPESETPDLDPSLRHDTINVARALEGRESPEHNVFKIGDQTESFKGSRERAKSLRWGHGDSHLKSKMACPMT